MEDAIRKSIEGGYRKYRNFEFEDIKFIRSSLGVLLCDLTMNDVGSTSYTTVSVQEILLDPDFWKCLGKSLGWEGDYDIAYKRQYMDEQWTKIKGVPSWMYYQHRFIDHLAEGRNADSFFKALLTT